MTVFGFIFEQIRLPPNIWRDFGCDAARYRSTCSSVCNLRHCSRTGVQRRRRKHMIHFFRVERLDRVQVGAPTSLSEGAEFRFLALLGDLPASRWVARRTISSAASTRLSTVVSSAPALDAKAMADHRKRVDVELWPRRRPIQRTASVDHRVADDIGVAGVVVGAMYVRLF